MLWMLSIFSLSTWRLLTNWRLTSTDCWLTVEWLLWLLSELKMFYRETIDKLIHYFRKNLSGMGKEMTFLLGFYVSNIVKRWWDTYKTLPWPDSLVAISHALVDFKNERSMEFCQTILRYCMLSYILCIRRLSKALKKMFPNDKSLIKAKVATRKELLLIEKQGELGRVWWIPISWCMTMIKR